MKNIITTALLFISISVNCQNEIVTVALKGDQLITYAAENFPSEKRQQLYIIVETGSGGIDLESRFYVEKGILLLLKRLNEEDQIALGVYGKAQGIILPYTAISSKEVILEKIESLFNGTFKTTKIDGIDLAYEAAVKAKIDEAISTVIMLRGTSKNGRQEITLQKNAYGKTNTTSTTKSEFTATEQEAQREQAKATNHSKLGGAIALTALTILPDLIEIIKD